MAIVTDDYGLRTIVFEKHSPITRTFCFCFFFPSNHRFNSYNVSQSAYYSLGSLCKLIKQAQLNNLWCDAIRNIWGSGWGLRQSVLGRAHYSLAINAILCTGTTRHVASRAGKRSSWFQLLLLRSSPVRNDRTSILETRYSSMSVVFSFHSDR